MALSDENNMVMPVAPMYGGNNGGFGSFGGDGWWIILLLLACGGGWGFGGGFGGGYGNMMLGYDFPWLLNGQNGINGTVNAGFQNAMLNDGITSIRDGISGIQNSLCSGFAGVNQSVANGFAQAEIAANSRQMADMNQMFGIQSALQNCCCENRASIADLKYTVASEECATRANDTQNTQSVLNIVNSGIQSIKDQLCQDKIDAKNDTIAQLRQELLFAREKASQDVQTAELRAAAQTANANLLNEMRNCPIPAQPVYGSQAIFTCGQNSGCGCGCGA
jgi:hypothetical protein